MRTINPVHFAESDYHPMSFLIVLAALSSITGVAVAALVTKLVGFAGGALTLASAANYVKNKYESEGVCSSVVNYLAGATGGNLNVQAKIINHATCRGTA